MVVVDGQAKGIVTRDMVTGEVAAHAGDAVLLSPACASLDMFRNYGHRAEVFINAVQELIHERGDIA